MTYFLEMDWNQRIKYGQKICGDRIFMHRMEDRDVIVLSDGLGSGIKANVMATLTGVMARKYVCNRFDITQAARTIMDTLPVCRERKISYATFTICDISRDGMVKIIEYDNPSCLFFREGKELLPEKTIIPLNRKKAYKKEFLQYSETHMEYGDRLVFISDGVSQAGLGSNHYPLGWRACNVGEYIEDKLKNNPQLSARELSVRLTSKACLLDGGHAKDDITAAVVYYRRPRQLLVVTGPPRNKSVDQELACRVEAFSDPVILAGGTTASILSRELNRPLTFNLNERTAQVPPTSSMKGIALVTEGMLTLNRVAEILENREKSEFGTPDGAGLLSSLLIESDQIHFLVGTRVNEAHHDSSIPEDIGIRRTIIRRIGRILEDQYFKTVTVEYL